MEPLRLWRAQDGYCYTLPMVGHAEYAALPRAEYDALEARLARAEKERDEAVARTELWRAARQRSEDYIASIVKAAGETWDRNIDFVEHVANLAAAIKQRDGARGLLREVRPYLAALHDGDDCPACELRARIDRCLEDKA